MIYLAYGIHILAGFFDCLIKEKLIKANIGKGKRWVQWGDVPKYWQDWIDDDSPFRVRHSYVINILFLGISIGLFQAIYQAPVYGGISYLILLGMNWEHIFYQWWAGFLVKKKSLFDICNYPKWMMILPWNRYLAWLHGEPILTSEEILTIGIFGILLLSRYDCLYSLHLERLWHL